MEIKFLNHETMQLDECIDNMYNDQFYYEYLSTERVLSYSSLKQVIKSPKWFDYKRRNPDPETQALRDGRLVHASILEPRKYEDFYWVDVQSKNTKKWKDAVATHGKANTFTIKEKYMNARITDAFLANDMCTKHLEGAKTEVPGIYVYDNIPFRVKADIIQGYNCIDVKTTSDSPEYFKRTVEKYDYDLQAYLYMSAFNCDTFTWLLIDKVTTDIGYAQIDHDSPIYARGEEKFYAGVDLYKTFFVDKDLDLHQYYKEVQL